jgi:hypothetical protein
MIEDFRYSSVVLKVKCSKGTTFDKADRSTSQSKFVRQSESNEHLNYTFKPFDQLISMHEHFILD